MNEPLTGAERLRKFRAAKKAAGWKEINVLLDPQAVAALEACKAESKATQSEIVSVALKVLPRHKMTTNWWEAMGF